MSYLYLDFDTMAFAHVFIEHYWSHLKLAVVFLHRSLLRLFMISMIAIMNAIVIMTVTVILIANNY